MKNSSLFKLHVFDYEFFFNLDSSHVDKKYKFECTLIYSQFFKLMRRFKVFKYIPELGL